MWSLHQVVNDLVSDLTEPSAVPKSSSLKAERLIVLTTNPQGVGSDTTRESNAPLYLNGTRNCELACETIRQILQRIHRPAAELNCHAFETGNGKLWHSEPGDASNVQTPAKQLTTGCRAQRHAFSLPRGLQNWDSTAWLM